MAALCTDLTREAIFEAIWARRTYALTGDRIEMNVAVNGAPMGATIDAGQTVEVAFDVQGRDEMDVVEVIQDGHVAHRSFPETRVTPEEALGGPFQIRLEWGWGPWGDLALERICDWVFDIGIKDGRLLRVFPCLQSGPFDENRRHRFTHRDNGLSVVSHTSRRGAYRQVPNQSVVLELEGYAETRIGWKFSRPIPQEGSASIHDLFSGSIQQFTGPFPKESYLWHRLVPTAASRVSGRCVLDVPARGRSTVYVRARQQNGHLAWASPVFIDRS